MVKGILSDLDVRGQLNKLVHFLRDGEWQPLWDALHLQVFSFADHRLSDRESDARVWQVCQAEQIILVTGNRNRDGPDSLEATIREKNTDECLPVLTLVDPKRVMNSHSYAERVALRMLEYLLDMENLRGTGRLFLP
jgi:hypothetical protein